MTTTHRITTGIVLALAVGRIGQVDRRPAQHRHVRGRANRRCAQPMGEIHEHTLTEQFPGQHDGGGADHPGGPGQRLLLRLPRRPAGRRLQTPAPPANKHATRAGNGVRAWFELQSGRTRNASDLIPRALTRPLSQLTMKTS
jgi:hypothetical protein